MLAVLTGDAAGASGGKAVGNADVTGFSGTVGFADAAGLPVAVDAGCIVGGAAVFSGVAGLADAAGMPGVVGSGIADADIKGSADLS